MNRRYIRIICLAVIALAALTLSGCRTRIIDSDEVTVTVYDEDGMAQEDYRFRREELGLYETKDSIFSRFWSSYDDSDEDYYEEDDEINYEDYEEEDPEDTDVDTSEKKNDSTVPDRRTPSVKPVVQTGIVVTLDANGGEISVASTKVKTAAIRVKKGEKYGALPVPVYEGHTFKGWYTDKEKGSKVDKDTKVKKSEAHTLYAHWKQNEKEPEEEDEEITVTLDANGGEVETSSVKVDPDGTYGELPAAVRDGYEFGGWYTDPEEGELITAETEVLEDEDHTLYAHWTEAAEDNAYNLVITYKYEDGATEDYTETKTLRTGDAYGALAEASRRGYNFLGWFTEAGGSGTQVTADSVYDKEEDSELTLYADWEKDPEKYWAAELADGTDSLKDEDKWSCYMYIGGDTMSSDDRSFIKASGGRNAEAAEADRIILIVKDADDEDEVKTAKDAFLSENEGLETDDDTFLVLPEISIKTDKESERLYYKICLYNDLYNVYTEDEMKAVREELLG